MNNDSEASAVFALAIEAEKELNPVALMAVLEKAGMRNRDPRVVGVAVLIMAKRLLDLRVDGIGDRFISFDEAAAFVKDRPAIPDATHWKVEQDAPVAPFTEMSATYHRVFDLYNDLTSQLGKLERNPVFQHLAAETLLVITAKCFEHLCSKMEPGDKEVVLRAQDKIRKVLIQVVNAAPDQLWEGFNPRICALAIPKEEVEQKSFDA